MSKTKSEKDQAKRNALRAALVGTKQVRKTIRVMAFGHEIELRQSTLKSVLDSIDNSDGQATKVQVVNYLIDNAYVPDTDLLLFEKGDEPQILDWPFGDEFVKVQEAMNTLMGIDITKAEKEIKDNPLDEPS